MGALTERARVALRRPDSRRNLSRFPIRRWPRAVEVWRAHSVSFGVWWFSSDMSGRFDLATPNGTCYLASDAAVALRERLGERLLSHGFAMRTALMECLVTHLAHPDGKAGPKTADLAHERAVDFGVSREIHATQRYDLTQGWAAALHAAGFGALCYQPRFSTSRDAEAYALFGHAAAGEPDSWRGWNLGASLTGVEVAMSAGIDVRDRPGRVC